MKYLVTNQEDEFFPNKKIIAGITMHEENPNYIFATYKDILTAKFIQPTLENQNFGQSRHQTLLKKMSLENTTQHVKELK